ncbi:MAG TPA: hypothetical protein PKN75_13035 [Bacteroidia bacterium]|nr:hypothetical protein [Bacteroidia bacterium]HNU34505.1 hypothetical protein [Bacteroidia bacterium]
MAKLLPCIALLFCRMGREVCDMAKHIRDKAKLLPYVALSFCSNAKEVCANATQLRDKAKLFCHTG